ncbi:hypothetical protein E2562_016806 [Oryza meyeriana var. granulata]|uniref:MATH domain-containing protein n=1 Tax=Oryza meyeriana var. granulata TaxID=110450 RepID=A0A6G1BWW5_9ORYZ|nr:hypothetical protein E2562_016806 [Oryza meyeriana var. granulata]
MGNSLLSIGSSIGSSPDDRSIRLPETLSRCVTASVAAAHNFEVPRYSLLEGVGAGKFVTSGTFSVDGHDWNITVYPDGWTEESYVSVFLCLCGGGATGVMTKYTLSLLENGGGAFVQRSLTHHFNTLGAFWGFTRCSLTVIREPRNEDVTAVAVPPSDMRRFLANMLRDGDGADVVVVVRDQLFRAHRCTLAARPPVFRAPAT